MGVVKQIDIKNRTYCFYNDMNNIKNFENSSLEILLKINKKSYKDISITTMNILQLRKLMTVKTFTV